MKKRKSVADIILLTHDILKGILILHQYSSDTLKPIFADTLDDTKQQYFSYSFIIIFLPLFLLTSVII